MGVVHAEDRTHKSTSFALWRFENARKAFDWNIAYTKIHKEIRTECLYGSILYNLNVGPHSI